VIELLYVVALFGGATGLGQSVLHRVRLAAEERVEEMVFGAAVGLGLLVLVMMALGLLGWLDVWTLRGAAVAVCAIGLRSLWLRGGLSTSPLRGTGKALRSPYLWFGVVALLASLLNLVRALAPPHGATDPLAYQLALPKLYLAEGELGFHPTITGSLYPSNLGLLYVLGLALRNGVVAQVMHACFVALVCFGVYGIGKGLADRKAGVMAASIFSFMPVVVVFGPQGYVDVGLCFFQGIAFWALWNWRREQTRRHLVLAALLAGLAAGVKHQGLTTVLLGAAFIFGHLLWNSRSWKRAVSDACLFVALALALVLPWYIRAYVLAGNPVWPLANSVFHGLPFGSGPVVASGATLGGAEARWWNHIVPTWQWFKVYANSMNPWKWTFEPQGWQKAIGVYFVALLPGACLLWRQPAVRWLVAGCGVYYVVLVRVLHMNPRYGLVMFALASLLCALVVRHFSVHPWRPVRVILWGALLCTAALNMAWLYALARPLLPVVMGQESRDVYLARHEGNYRLFRRIDEVVPVDGRVLLQGIVKGYYCERSYLWDHPYQAILRYRDYSSPADLADRLRELGVTHIARMINIPSGRQKLGYPQYFADPFHEAFRRDYLDLVYRDESYALFAIRHPRKPEGSAEERTP
jgi:4-amino-4-deoxy-L-arabinose transferase-like glycosyltransferase